MQKWVKKPNVGRILPIFTEITVSPIISHKTLINLKLKIPFRIHRFINYIFRGYPAYSAFNAVIYALEVY